jgi:hypothetical protein
VHAVPEGEVLLVGPGDVEGVGVGAVAARVAARGGVRGEDGLSLGDDHPVRAAELAQHQVLHGVPQRQAGHRRLDAQRLLDDVLPAGPPGADVGELAGVGEQQMDGVVDEVDGGLVPGADHQHEGVQQFLLAQPGGVLVVAGGDQRRGEVVARGTPFERDEFTEYGVETLVDVGDFLR